MGEEDSGCTPGLEGRRGIAALRNFLNRLTVKGYPHKDARTRQLEGCLTCECPLNTATSRVDLPCMSLYSRIYKGTVHRRARVTAHVFAAIVMVLRSRCIS